MHGSGWCTIEEFYEDWVDYGYPSDSEFAAIFSEAQIMVSSEPDPDPVAQQQTLDLYGLKERLDHLWVYR